MKKVCECKTKGECKKVCECKTKGECKINV